MLTKTSETFHASKDKLLYQKRKLRRKIQEKGKLYHHNMPTSQIFKTDTCENCK